jgi:hypothetical protein
MSTPHGINVLGVEGLKMRIREAILADPWFRDHGATVELALSGTFYVQRPDIVHVSFQLVIEFPGTSAPAREVNHAHD